MAPTLPDATGSALARRRGEGAERGLQQDLRDAPVGLAGLDIDRDPVAGAVGARRGARADLQGVVRLLVVPEERELQRRGRTALEGRWPDPELLVAALVEAGVLLGGLLLGRDRVGRGCGLPLHAQHGRDRAVVELDAAV